MFTRYAIFYTPPPGPFAEAGAQWLGWDSRAGAPASHPPGAGLDLASLTATPRKYGFHATLKAPFRLAPGVTQSDLEAHAETVAARLAPVRLDGLTPQHFHGFVALRPVGDVTALNHFAAEIVRGFEPCRAPLTDADIARRRQSPLTPRQDAQMLQWGYPYIFEDFHFHMTLSGRVDEPTAHAAITALETHLTPTLPHPVTLDAISVLGEAEDGRFHELTRAGLTGTGAP